MTEREPRAWHILTGEYPPTGGGVSDYTRQIARGISEIATARGSGAEVHVWAPSPPGGGALTQDPGVTAHALSSTFGPRAILELNAGLDALPGPRRLLVQYVPHAFGMKGMNLLFCAWLASRRDDEIWIMFHEVVYPWRAGQKAREAMLALVTRAMAAMVVRRADRLFVSVPFWGPYMRTFLPRCPTPTWLPIPSNLPTAVDAPARVRARSAILRLADRAEEGEGAPQIIGHFGTYGAHIGTLLVRSLRAYDAKRAPRDVVWLMLGRGAPAFVAEHFPDRRDMLAPGDLSLESVAEHLAACDVVLQPYVDGVSARRTSAMASLALGRPLVTNDGPITEPEWRRGAVALAHGPDPDAIAALLLETLAAVRDPARAAAFSAAGRALYEAEFSIERTMRTLHPTSSAES